MKIIYLLILFSLTACGQEPQANLANATGTPDWQFFQKILDLALIKKNYTGANGDFFHHSFDYEKLSKINDAKTLVSQQQENLKLAAIPKNRDEQLAFWINAYNFFTIVDVLSNHPVKSLKDIGWKNRHHLVSGIKYSLDDIEHKILRPLKEPRIHFAINCASVSCPSLNDKVFISENITETLKNLTENAFRNPLHLELKNDKVNVTKLLDWFEEDFEISPYKTPAGFIKVHAAPSFHKKINSYLNYDWNLNSPENLDKTFKALAIQEKK